MATTLLLPRQLPRRCCSRPSLTVAITRSFAAKSSSKKKKKNQAATASTPAATADTGRDKNLELILASLNAPERKEPEISPEEKARRYEIGRNYVIGSFKEHNEIHHNLSCKIHLKKHAVKMLPRNSKLKEEAMKIDGEGPPPWRLIAKWTAPIPGYNPMDFIDKE